MTTVAHPTVSLVADGLSVRRSRSFALTDIDLTVSGGEVLILVGPNGSGKSTLAGTLAGLLAPTKGQVRLGDIDLGTLSPRDRARRIGLLPQQARSAWPVSVANLVAFGGIPPGVVPTVPAAPTGRLTGPSRQRWRRWIWPPMPTARSPSFPVVSRRGRIWRGCWRVSRMWSSPTSRSPS